MQKPPRVTKWSLGTDPTVGDILEMASWLKDVNPEAKAKLTKEFGQRDAEYTFLTITEDDW